jgi:cell division septation protein DedD
VTVYTRLEPLSVDDVVGYVQHRLQIAGASPHRPVFAPSALSLLHEASGGVPRLINRICDRALHLAHEHRSPLIDSSLVAEAIVDVPAPANPRVSAPAATAPPAAGSAAFATKVDAWLTHLDGGKSVAAVPAALSEFAEEATIQTDAPATKAVPFEAPLRRRQPERYLHKLGRRWARAVVVGILALVALNAVVAAGTYVPSRLAPPLEAGDLPPVPAAPKLKLTPVKLPAAPAPGPIVATPRSMPAEDGQFSVAVGAFSTTRRADQLRSELNAGGFQAFTVIVQSRNGVLHQVVVGPFASEADALAELKRLRATGGFADARVMALRPSTASPRTLEESVP